MNTKERNEHRRLLTKWATGRATRREIDRCMELDRRSSVCPSWPRCSCIVKASARCCEIGSREARLREHRLWAGRAVLAKGAA